MDHVFVKKAMFGMNLDFVVVFAQKIIHTGMPKNLHVSVFMVMQSSHRLLHASLSIINAKKIKLA